MRRLRSWSLALGFLIVGVALGISLAKDTTPRSEATASPARSGGTAHNDRTVGASASSSNNGPDQPTPVVEYNSPELAAVRFLELTEEVVQLSPEAGAEMQQSIASKEASDRLSTEVFDLLTQLQTDVPEGVVVHLAPLSVSSFETTTGWDVSIWYVEVIVYGDQLAVEQWRTATYSLVDEDGEWRMDGLESSVGPVPTRPASAVGWSAASLTSAVVGFDDEVLEP